MLSCESVFVPTCRDIVFELLELCETLLVDIEQQLLYYRASVYKDETARSVELAITRLPTVLKMFSCDALLEPLSDYRALQLHDLKLTPGECSLSRKVAILVAALREQLRCYRTTVPPEVDFSAQLQQHRPQLLALCRQGSRRWNFFRSL